MEVEGERRDGKKEKKSVVTMPAQHAERSRTRGCLLSTTTLLVVSALPLSPAPAPPPVSAPSASTATRRQLRSVRSVSPSSASALRSSFRIVQYGADRESFTRPHSSFPLLDANLSTRSQPQPPCRPLSPAGIARPRRSYRRNSAEEPQ